MQEMQEIQVLSLGWKVSLEEEMSTHQSILVYKIPWTEESGELQSMGFQNQTRLTCTETLILDKIFKQIIYVFLIFWLHWVSNAVSGLLLLWGTSSVAPWHVGS